MITMLDPLRIAIDATPAMLWSTEADGSVDFLNQRWLDYAGLTLEVAKVDWILAVHPSDRGGLIEYWQGLLATGQPGDFEARIRRADGVYRWFIFRAAPYCDESGRIVKWFGQNVDIEDRRRAEERLAGAKRVLEMMAVGKPVGHVLETLCLVVEELAPGTSCVLLQVDPQTQRLMRGAAPSLPASFVDELHGRPVNLDAGPCSMSACLNEPVISEDSTLETRWELYSWRSLALAHGFKSVWSTPIVSLDGQVLGTLDLYWGEPGAPTPHHRSLIEQFTAIASIALERARQENALRLSEEILSNVRLELARVARVATLGELTASIAHEVNQPLSGIVTNASTSLRLLSLMPPNLEGAREASRRMIRDANRAADVISRLRELFKKRTTTSGQVDLSTAAREVIALMHVELQRSQIQLRTTFAPDLPPVDGDRVQLQQVIMNLIVNATEAMGGVEDRPRQLEIRTGLHEGGVCLSVRDTGAGIDHTNAERMFEAFYTSKIGGMGMGLSISRSIVEAHRGRLWNIPNDGPGATFAFSLPPVLSDGGR